MSKRDKDNFKDYKQVKEDSDNGEDMKKTVGYKKYGRKVPKGTFKKKVKEEIEVEELEEEIELLRKELKNYKEFEEEYQNRIKRLQADYDNYRKRTLREHLEHIKRANKDLIKKLLPVIDNFEIALDAGKKMKKGGSAFFKGVEMIYENLIELLKKENVKIINPKGEEFNPEICEAAVTEAVEGVDEGIVLDVIRKGYMIDNFLIRPAVVKVCKEK